MKKGGPAFLSADFEQHEYTGMILRDWFSGQAMQAWLTKYPDDMSDNRAAAGVDTVARFAYAMADAMLSQREKS